MALQNSELPSSFENEVIQTDSENTILRSNLKNISDVKAWIAEYGRNTNTNGIFAIPIHLVYDSCALTSTYVTTILSIKFLVARTREESQRTQIAQLLSPLKSSWIPKL
ncbi:hypothetical protein AVEN_236507-1 [Araneus ventricosus]|uniref:Uncharacterized protein n=1 Tax=Araneus ventricosus TaxID=182803 RepID=A0A4Y2DD95_ARAVE|nr:hypothetical protein AVEN_44101-1 [Araneus ventricosus]GBN68627.1 hypothetical protein AVEN_54884-1 [Araneus ventricosus]GBO41766.1 hypothetical protein AVEN_236507-1 [Araneus ventricosus]